MKHLVLFALSFVGLMALALMTPAPALAANCDTSSIVFSEIDYDQPGTDTTEFIELRIDTASTISNCELHLVNGSGGVVYDTVSIAGTYTVGEYVIVGGTDTPGVDIILGGGTCASNCIQNGAPDGIALVDTSGSSATVVEFLSYEGTMTYLTVGSTDIGCTEDNVLPNLSCHNGPVAGHGDWYSDTPNPGNPGPLAVELSEMQITEAGSGLPLVIATGLFILMAVSGGWVLLKRTR